MVRENEYSSYPRFELTSDFYREVLGKAQGMQETVRDNKSSSYPQFELPGVNCIYPSIGQKKYSLLFKK